MKSETKEVIAGKKRALGSSSENGFGKLDGERKYVSSPREKKT